MKTKGIILTMLSSITFGFAFTLGPLTYGVEGSNPVTLTFLRNFLSLPFLLIIVLLLRINLKVTKKQFRDLVILGFVGNAITTLLLNMAFAHIDVGIVTPIHFTYPIFVTLGCVMFFQEKLSKQKVLALIIAMSGISCFFVSALTSASFGSSALMGLILAIVSGVFYAFYIIFMDKSGLKSEPPFKITFYVALASTIGMYLYGKATQELVFSTLTTKAWIISALFAFLCTVVALSLLQLGIKYVGASEAAVITTFEPITSVIFGAILLGEKITLIKIIACLLIFAGVLTLSFSKNKEAQLEADEESKSL
ncbi:DMT family transporter [Clostridium chauvoei]|uniref:DMT family transporter n=2 Tax=Clostridium chauvoei TaxID=46867 RepID=A0ABD4RG83_9CLOT|nr:DMT family transporter [Clostridium chauvoei]ATD55840.1 EamA family transporter [Clostridium chauvoei]ATD56487.1 EamA family transporter [Clostridium chauvoei]MBX7280198.1 DMT family transporter [Clostridium chauvoei]MBX7282692.1 DMT family transporter [Clostridium chauvoei]MBX7285089.1 DMT family transporter [Clostridium chauvoei]